MQAPMVRELGAIIRNQIPSGRRSMLDAYGEILLRAWRDCTGASLLATEDLIQVPQLLPQPALLCNAHPACGTFVVCQMPLSTAHQCTDCLTACCAGNLDPGCCTQQQT